MQSVTGTVTDRCRVTYTVTAAIRKTVINHSWQNWMQWKTFDLLKSATGRLLRDVWGFRREVAANCALLGSYAASGG
jgi:hypothetical protein